jgi:hypothetical protein
MASNAKITKKRRGRPPGSRKSDAATKAVQKPPTTKTKPNRTRASQAEPEAEDELSGMVAEEALPSRPRKRKAHTETDDVADDGQQAPRAYVQLEAKTKRIPQEQIETWPQVSSQVLEQIVAVIRDAKKDIANTQRDERRVIAAHNALNPIVRKLTRQLAASRIPPQAHVSREVTTARHSKQMLSEQVKVAEHMLNRDEENLEELKKNAKKWRTEWKHQEKHGRVCLYMQRVGSG